MAEHNELGREGEELAANYLAKKDFTILERNWKSGKLEIDLIAETGKFVVFVEVKTRSSAFMDAPSQLIPVRKQKMLFRAADVFIKRKGIQKEGRFDAIFIVKNDKTMNLTHMEDAFFPTT